MRTRDIAGSAGIPACIERREARTTVSVLIARLQARNLALPTRGLRFLSAAFLCLFFSGCRGGIQSAIDPAGPQAGRISKLWWLMFYVCSVVFVLVIIAALIAVVRSRSKQSKAARVEKITDKPKLSLSKAEEQRMTRTVQGAVAVTVVILFVFLIASFSIGRSLSSDMENKGLVTIEVTGHQWWWEVRYMDTNPSKIFTTANEIHIPVGQPVTLKLHSTDVIHSFWVPNLNGKKDLIPGKDATIWLQADQAGVYRGQCAEYCGLQHAHMALFVFAEPVDKFNAWMDAQRAESVAPSNESEQRGQQVFLTSPCIMCHTIQGTQANATTGPNLTHVASRSTIAAGTLPFTRGHLSGWIVDSQSIKPGNHMPPIALNSEDVQALLDYLQSLK